MTTRDPIGVIAFWCAVLSFPLVFVGGIGLFLAPLAIILGIVGISIVVVSPRRAE
jgi:hypothetical protein